MQNLFHIMPCVSQNGCGRSSGVEYNLAKVGVEGSNPFARSILDLKNLERGKTHVF